MMASAKKVGTKKASAKDATEKDSVEKPPSRRSVSLPTSGQDPKGGLTAEGRRVYNQATGGNLKPGVRGEADTPEKMLRKGSVLRRHFANPPGPVVDDKGQPTRQALEAAAWGEPVPKSEADEKKLAEKGTELLEKYHAAKGEVRGAAGKWKAHPAAKGTGTKQAAGATGTKGAKKAASGGAEKARAKKSS